MDDSKILELYFKRSEDAISETEKKYGRYCQSIAYNILRDRGESEECVNESFFKTWNTIPPECPCNLAAFLGKIVRNTAFDKYVTKRRLKRGSGNTELILDELAECAGRDDVEKEIDRKEAGKAILDFLNTLDVQKRRIFILRYWYAMPVKEIAEKQNLKESNVKVILHRLRAQLKDELTKNEIV